MAEQLTLDQAGQVPTVPVTPDEKWAKACVDNPHLKSAIVDCARQLAGQGRRVTVAVLWEELRTRIHTVGDVYRMNNTWRAPAARWLKATHPDLAVDMKLRGTT